MSNSQPPHEQESRWNNRRFPSLRIDTFREGDEAVQSQDNSWTNSIYNYFFSNRSDSSNLRYRTVIDKRFSKYLNLLLQTLLVEILYSFYLDYSFLLLFLRLLQMVCFFLKFCNFFLIFHLL